MLFPALRCFNSSIKVDGTKAMIYLYIICMYIKFIFFRFVYKGAVGAAALAQTEKI